MPTSDGDPCTFGEWCEVALARARDADALDKSDERRHSHGAEYMAGYAVESALKALLMRQGKGLPPHGREGHNLCELWKRAGLVLRDLSTAPDAGFFHLEWSTALRYRRDDAEPESSQRHVASARKLVSRIFNEMKRTRTR